MPRDRRLLSLSRIAPALLIATALCAVFASRVYVEFHAERFKVVTAPLSSSAGRLLVTPDPRILVGDLETPFAMIARLENDATAPAAFTFQTDGRVICRVIVKPGPARRVDCAVTGAWSAGDHRILITGPDAPWSLEYLELATHHGATRAYDLVIIPAASHRYRSPTTASVLWVGLVITLLFLLPPAAMRPGLRALWWGLAAATTIFFGLVFGSALASPYRVLVSETAFAEGVLLVGAPRVWTAAAAVASWYRRQRYRAWVAPVLIGVLVLTAYGRLVHYDLDRNYGGNFSGFLMLGHEWYDADPTLNQRQDIRQTLQLGDGGYDAQFMYLEAYDPFLRTYRGQPAVYGRFIDAPPYRYGRIGFPLLTDLVSLGHWPRYPATMMGLVLAALFLTGFILAAVAREVGASPCWGLLVLLVPGFWESVQVSLPEPIAGALLLGGYWCWLQRRYAWAGFLLACSLLVRETGTVLVLALAAATLISAGRRDAVRLTVIAFAPVAIWRLYVGWVFWPTWGLHGLFFNSHDLGVPFAGIRTLWTLIHHHQYYGGIEQFARAGTWYPFVITAGAVLAVWAAVLAPGPVSVAAVVYGAVAVSLNYKAVWVYVGNGQRTTYELFLMLALLSVGVPYHRRVFRSAAVLFWAATAAYVLFGGFDAEHIRQVVLSPFF
ncbi:MAG TPA: hypothetical protein VIC33_07005 [Vicinamibacterales bacterium]